MSDNDFQIPESLKDALKRGQVVPFIGAGVSRAVEKKDKDPNKPFNPLFPSWKEFLTYSVVKLESRKEYDEAEDIKQILALKKPMYLEAASRASKALGETLWHQMLKEKLDLQKANAEESSLKLPQIVWELGSELLITTNVDRVLQWTCPNSGEFRPFDMEKYELGELQKEKEVKYPTVLYLHGRIHNKKNVVFTPEQYKRFYEEGSNQAKLQTLLNLLTNYTTLFIGFSLDDEYFLKQLNYIDEIYEGGANSFYILLPEEEKDNPNIPKYVEKIVYAHHGKPLLDLLEEMKRIAKGDDDSDETDSSLPPDTLPLKSDLSFSTQTSPSATTSSTQKLFKTVLGEEHMNMPSAPKDAFKNHFNVPFASKGDAFVGREGLREKIWELLNRNERVANGQSVNIKGIGGLGKTQLAVEYAHAYRNRYENGVFWLTADEDINIQLIKIGEDLNWISQFDTGFDQAELVRNRFRKLSDCLIIFDNVDERKAIENYLPESDARPHILITSREEQEFFDEINLDVLSRDESQKLLLEVSGRSLKDEADEKAFEKILDELGDLPLAVVLVGGFLAEHTIISFREYLEFLDAVPLDALEKDFPSISFTHHDKSIIRTLRISEKVLTKKPYLEEILDLLAWSGKSSMGYSLLQSLIGIENNYTLTTALSDLVNLRLIKEEKPAKRFTIHRLVARVRRFENPLAGRKEWHQKIVGKLVEWFRRRKDEFEYLAEFENETIHLQQWQSQSVDVLPIETVYLTDFEAYPLWHRGNYQESKILLEKALNLYQENQLNDEKLLANLYNDLGVIAGKLGNFNQAFEFHQKSLSIGRNVFDEKSADIAKFLNNLGSTYHDLGNYQKALELKEQALKMQQELFGEKHPDIADSLNNLGSTYGDLGNHQKALELNEQALKMQQELFGEKHPDIADSLNNLGSTYGELGNYQKVLELNEQALKMRQKLFGEKHPDIAQSLNNVGYTYEQLNNKQKAIDFYESALKMRRELSGEKHPDTILTCRNLIRTLSKLGKREQAGRLAGEFLSYVPQNHPNRKFFEKYGAAYRKVGKKKRRH